MPYIAGKKSTYDRVHILEEHAHSASNCYPTLANGTTVTGAVGAWTLGAFAEVVPASTITEPFDVHFISIEDLSAVDVYEIVLYAATTEIGRIRVARTANQDSTTQVPIQMHIQPANTQIQAKCATSAGGSDTAVIALHYHTY